MVEEKPIKPGGLLEIREYPARIFGGEKRRVLARRQKFRRQDFSQDQRVGAESTSSEVQEPFDDHSRDLLAKGVKCTADGHTEVNLSNRARHIQEPCAVTAHLDDVSAVLVYAVRNLGSLLA